MDSILIEELIYYKILPFAIYDSGGNLLFTKGVALNSEILSILKKMPVLYKKNGADQDDEKIEINKLETSSEAINSEHEKNIKNKLHSKLIVEKFDFMRTSEKQPHSFIDGVDINNYSGPLNKKSKIEFDTQIKIKTVFINAIGLFCDGEISDSLALFLEIRSKINDELKALADNIHRCSELLFLGEYTYCHMLNTAMLSTALAIKLGYSENDISDVTLAALLHDIGKFKMEKTQPIKDHALVGYNIIKNDFKLSKSIALSVLGHHENNDGSGYPKGLSGEQIDITSNIINICSTFDNLLFNRTPIKVNNNREALREMLNIGTNVFLPELFYTFIHMFSYNDSTPLEEMLFE